MRPDQVPQFRPSTAGVSRPPRTVWRRRAALGACPVLLLVAVAWLVGAGCENTVEPVARSGDRTPPTVREVRPAPGSIDVATTAEIEVVFAEPVDPATVSLAHFKVLAGAAAITGVIRAATGGAEFTFSSTSGRLPPQTALRVTLDEGIRDLSGNALGEPYTWTFTTRADDPDPGTPTAPTPADGATGVSIDPGLAWETVGGGTVDHFDLWLGDAPDALQPLVTALEATAFRVGPLAYDGVVYWQVVGDLGGATLAGPVWEFRTIPDPTPGNQPPTAPDDLLPADGEERVDPTAALTWSGGADPDADPVTFEVYLGTTVDPPLVAEVTERRFEPDGFVIEGTRYWWRIIAADGRGGRSGSARQWFQTGAANLPPGEPTDPVPVDDATGVAVDTTLGWSEASDPEGGRIVYDLHLGTDSPPPLVAAGLDTTGYRLVVPLGYETDYYWQVVARDSVGLGTSGPIWHFRTERENNPPTAPCGPEPPNDATGIAVTTTLTWGCGVDPDPGDTVEFDVYLEAGASNPAFVATVGEASYTPPEPLERGRPYFWRVVARDPGGLETPGPTWFFETDSNRPPNAPPSWDPTPANGAMVSAQTLFFSWECATDPDMNGASYEFYLALGQPSFGEPRVVVPFAQCNAGPFGIGLGQWYWQVVAVDEAGARTASPIWSFQNGVANAAPSAPANPDPADASTIEAGSIVLGWDCSIDPDGDDVRYEVFVDYGEEPTLDQPSASTGFGVCETGQLDLGPAPLAYYWRVVAIDDRGAETVGPVWSFTVTFDNAAPSTPCDPVPVSGATGVPLDQTLGWSCGEDPDGHDVEFDIFLDSEWPPTTLRATTSARSWTPDGVDALELGTTYYWRVRARDTFGAVSVGPVWMFQTVTNRLPTVPTDPVPADGATIDDRPNTFRWTCSDDLDGDAVRYDVYVARDAPIFDEPWRETDFGDCRTGRYDGGEGLYYWRVIAIDARGGVTEGSIWSFEKRGN